MKHDKIQIIVIMINAIISVNTLTDHISIKKIKSSTRDDNITAYVHRMASPTNMYAPFSANATRQH